MDEKTMEHLQGMQYGQEAMRWYGWGSPIGLGLGFGIVAVSGSLSLYLLHLANILK